MRRLRPLLVCCVALCLFSACGGKSGDGVVRIDGPDVPEPSRIAFQTLEPGPTAEPTPKPTPTPSPTATPPGVPAPKGATLRAVAGSQAGDVGRYCWREQVGGGSSCGGRDNPAQTKSLSVKQKEKVLLRIDAQIPPDKESVRPFQGTRSGFPDSTIDPALETELTIDLPKGEWSMDLCGEWDGRGELCWLFRLTVS